MRLMKRRSLANLNRGHSFLPILFLSVIITGHASAGLNDASVTDLKCEYLSNPFVIDTPEPRFSWIIESPTRSFVQSAYEIRAADSKENLEAKRSLAWSSGKVVSNQSVNITYDGKKLPSRTTFYWQVRVWDQAGNVSLWSRVASFHMGLLKKSDWTAQWIAATDIDNRSPLLRRSFDLHRPIERALVHVSSIGIYELAINGDRIGEYVLEPGATQNERRTLYTVYDVTDYLQPGKNAVGLWLGEGWGAYTINESRYMQRAKALGPFDRPKAILQLEVTYASGEREIIASDETWRTSPSPLTYNNFFGGEDYDARLEQPGWSKADFEDSQWRPALVQQVDTQLCAQMIPPMKVMEVLSPVAQSRPKKGVFVYDFGKTFGGWFRISVRGKAGTALKLRGSETLGDDLYARPLTDDVTLNFRHDCFRLCESHYTLNGDGVEVYEPRFYYNGYRYLQIETDQPEAVEIIAVEGRPVYTATDETGAFECSDDTLNQIRQITAQTVKTILQGQPTSNANDEKYGWTGDVHLFYEMTSHIFDMPAFWTKWLRDVADAQSMFDSGVVPNVAPHFHKIKDGAPFRQPTPAWGSAYPIVTWNTYLLYGDKRILREHFATVKLYCDYLTSLSEGNLVKGYIGDHNAPGFTAEGEHIDQSKPLETADLVASAYYYRSAQFVSEIANVLGEEKDRRRYAALAEKIKKAYNERFYDQEKKHYWDKDPLPGFNAMQAANLIPLQMGLVPEKNRTFVADKVIQDIVVAQQYRLFTGIMGTKAAVDVLPDYTGSELLYQVATQKEYPGWGFMLENGATAFWQKWTAHTGDHAHAMWGVIDEFLVETLAGIKSPINGDTSIGYNHIVIKPAVPQKMTFARATVKSIKGRIVSDWEKGEDKFTLAVEIPANTTATVCVPRLSYSTYTIKESGKIVWNQSEFHPGVEGVSSAKATEDYIEFDIGSGNYSFAIGR
jgi:alpha-L-rhamnosidase